MIQSGPMRYKTFLKVAGKDRVQRTHDEVFIRCVVVFEVVVRKKKKTEVARQYQMSRNTVQRLCDLFRTTIPEEKQKLLLTSSHVTQAHCTAYKDYLCLGSRTPHRHPKQATKAEEDFIQHCVEEKRWRFGAVRLWNTIRWSTDKDLTLPPGLTKEKIRGILRRNGYKKEKVRTKTGSTRPLYDYVLTPCLTYLHYDTKDLADQKSLPEPVYTHLLTSPGLPKVQWNIYDPISRLRFLAYAQARTATFGKLFLLFVVMHIRSQGHLHPITIFIDGGTEFCGGGDAKLEAWNTYFAPLNATIVRYEGARDTRKNPIERTHRSDDEEFLIPHTLSCTSLETFMHTASQWHTTWNTTRSHQGSAMNGRTPLQQLQYRNVLQAQQLVSTPVLHLETEMKTLLMLHQYYTFCTELPNLPLPFPDQKQQLQFLQRFPLIQKKYAQNVLHSYQCILRIRLIFCKQSSPF